MDNARLEGRCDRQCPGTRPERAPAGDHPCRGPRHLAHGRDSWPEEV